MHVRHGSLILVATMALGLLSATPGGAATAPARHCVVWISPVSPSTRQSQLSPLRCYTNFAKAQRAAHGPAPSGFDSAQNGITPDVSTTISIDHDGANYSGSTLTWTAPNSFGCNGGTYQAATMPSGWNDRVSSSHSYAGCAHNDHFHDISFSGSLIVCTCATMGTMSNQTSSETWTS